MRYYIIAYERNDSMSVFQAFILGIVQGLGEFLPISSSGHLVLTQTIFGIEEAGLLLDILLHIGTLIAVFIVFWNDIKNLILHPIRSDLWLLVIATIPAVIATVLFGDSLDSIFAGHYLGFSFIITSVILFSVEWASKHIVRLSSRSNVSLTDAVVMGCMQAVAILPGVSRSGSTIAGGLFRGLTRDKAARFSFLMSIPAIFGSFAMGAKDLITGDASIGAFGVAPLIIGIVTAAVFGFIAIRAMLWVLKNTSLNIFACYTFILGVFVLIDQNITHWFF